MVPKFRPSSYCRTTQASKLRLLYLVLKKGVNIKQAAKQLRINYSTAKTVLFFYRKRSSDFINSFVAQNYPQKKQHRSQVTYRQISPNENKPMIIVVSRYPSPNGIGMVECEYPPPEQNNPILNKNKNISSNTDLKPLNSTDYQIKSKQIHKQ